MEKLERDVFVDERGRYKTLSLFLEIQYDSDAIYTLKSYDHEYKGKTYISLKRLFLEMSDPTEYSFASKYLADWDHWKKICANKVLAQHIDQWRQELELKLRSEGIQWVLYSARTKRNWLAAKFLAEKGWEVKAGAGRPSKDEIQRELEHQASIDREYSEDLVRMKLVG